MNFFSILSNRFKSSVSKFFNFKSLYLNIIPLYEGQDPSQLQQKQASKEELDELEEKLKIEKTEDKEESKEPEKESEDKEEKKPEEINEENFWLPRRIP